jgi:hypothetical protein
MNWFKRKKKEEPKSNLSSGSYFTDFFDRQKRDYLKSISENFLLYYFCPNCDKYESYVDSRFHFEIRFSAEGCCTKCGTLRSKWILASAKLQSSRELDDGNWEALNWIISEHDESDIMKHHPSFTKIRKTPPPDNDCEVWKFNGIMRTKESDADKDKKKSRKKKD